AAEAAMHKAAAEHRRQEVRLLPLRDFRPVRAALVASAKQSRDVADLARTRSRAAKSSAQQALAEAEEAVAESVTFADAVPLGRSERWDYQQARLALDEARIQQRNGAVTRAADSARRATTLARNVT